MKRILKRLLKAVLVTVLVLVLLPFALFIIAPLLDTVALHFYKAETLRALSLPPDTAIVQAASGCGNTGGTGNHTELYVAVLVETSLSEEAFLARFPGAQPVAPQDDETWSMACVGVSFTQPIPAAGGYVLEYAKPAPFSAFDLRGH